MAGQPQFISDQIGNEDDTVDIQVGTDDPIIARKWTINEAVLQQPASWTLDFGHGTNALQLFTRYPNGTKYVLRIHGVPQLTGFTDRRRLATKRGASGTSLVMSGRDALAAVHTATCTAAESFKDSTNLSMVSRVLKHCGLDPSKLVGSNTANRNAKCGVSVTETLPPATVDGNVSIPGTIGATAAQLQANFGEGWLAFLRRHLDRQGLMLWCAGDGGFVLTAPNGGLAPTYTLYRSLASNLANVLDADIDDDATNRHTQVFTAGHGGGRKHGSVKALDSFIDQEMLDYLAIASGHSTPGQPGQGYDRPLAIHDPNVQTAEQAGFLARRKIAEERRDGWRLNYTIAGHTLPVAGGNANQRAVLTVDTTIRVQDELLGLDGVFYIEAVRRERNPNTETTIRLMRPEDLVFATQAKTTYGQTLPTQKPQPDGTTLPGQNYYALGVIPVGAVAQDPTTGQYIDANGNVVQ